MRVVTALKGYVTYATTVTPSVALMRSLHVTRASMDVVRRFFKIIRIDRGGGELKAHPGNAYPGGVCRTFDMSDF